MTQPTSEWLVFKCPPMAGFEVPGDTKASLLSYNITSNHARLVVSAEAAEAATNAVWPLQALAD